MANDDGTRDSELRASQASKGISEDTSKDIKAEIVDEESYAEKAAKLADSVSEIAGEIPFSKAQEVAQKAHNVADAIRAVDADLREIDRIAERVSKKVHEKVPWLNLDFKREILPR